MVKKEERLLIIDGSSLIHRAFYALPLLSTKDGLYTNGVYGFLTMLYRLEEDYEYDYISVVLDKKGPTFRHEMFDSYKGHRDKTPNELSLQFPLLKEVLKASNIKYLELDRYEADDIAGTLARIGEEEGLKVTLVTGDKDYLQLVTDNTEVLLTRRGITQLEKYTKEKILDEYGIAPKQFIDLKGLMGDQSDNIPGVPGIGEKTGLKFLREFGSMENLYENIEKVGGKKTKESLIEHKNIAFLSKKLGEIITNIPLDTSIEELRVVEPNWERLEEIYTKLEFNRLLERLPKNKAFKEENTVYKGEYQVVKDNNYTSIKKDIEENKSFAFKFLFHDDHYIKSKILGVGIKVGENPSYYISFEKNSIDKFMEEFKVYFEDENIEKYGHMLKMDIFGLLTLGVDIKNIKFDTMIGSYILDPAKPSYSIDELGKEFLNIYTISEEELLGKGKKKKTFASLSLEEQGQYIGTLLDLVMQAKGPIGKEIENQGMADLYYNIELPLVEVLAHMEYRGFKVDIDVLKDLGEKFQEEIDELTESIYGLAGEKFNINSPKQLGEILFTKLKLPVIKKTKTGYSTDAEVLDRLKGQHEIIGKILKYRQMVKLKTTYIDGLMNEINSETGKIHSTFNQTITHTGRISSTEPNLQNIPIRTKEGRMIRKAFVPKSSDYILVDGDYSQIELRVLAHISQDPKMMDAFHKNLDIHTQTASEVFNIPKEEVTPLMRDRAKAVNFGIVYGISDYGLSKDLDISRKEAKEYIDNYLKNFTMVEKYMKEIVKKGKEDGYVETLLNRRRYVPELKSRNYNVRSFGERVALNTPIQGTAADIIKIAMVKLHNELKSRKLKSSLILQVHDELIIETYKDEEEEVKSVMKNVMENAIKLDIPLKVEISTGGNWYET